MEMTTGTGATSMPMGSEGEFMPKSPRAVGDSAAYMQVRVNEGSKVTLEWENLNYFVKVKDSSKSEPFRTVYKNNHILNNISGSAKSGQLLAIMGPTGCGKTSLLNVLAARMPGGGRAAAKLTGKIFINGQARDDERMRRISAYVLQDDKLYPHLTVFETLLLSAHFYLPETVTKEQKETLVRSVISELGLVKVTNTNIGDEKVRGVSGGERKRANIGTQLISDPQILFLDEPTSGLDSFQAFSVMDSMKRMAHNGRLVISVIHQPRSLIYEMFDQLLLLSCGKTMYLGPAATATNYFESHGYVCPGLFNPSDFFLDILSPDNRNPELEKASNNTISTLADAWKAKVERDIANGLVKSVPRTSENVKQQNQPVSITRISKIALVLCWRAAVEQMREWPTIVIKLCITTFFSLIIGGIYSSKQMDQKSISNRIGLLFLICLNQGFNGMIGVLNTFPKEKVIVNRERASNAYDTLSYFCSKYLVEMPLNTVPCIWFACIAYWIASLNPDRFGYHILILMLEALIAVSLGLCVGAFTPNVEAALALGPPLIIIALIFGGFYINVDSLPIVANWLPYVSFLKWTFEALCINEFKGETFSCARGPPGACMPKGEDVLQHLSFDKDSIYQACFGMGMLLLGFTFSAVVLLHFSRMSYIQLGHVGRQQINFLSSNTEDADSVKVKETSEVKTEGTLPRVPSTGNLPVAASN